MILFSIIQYILLMNWKIIIGLFWVNSATVHSRRLLPFLRDVLISLVKKARRAIDTWCMFCSSASLAFTAVIMHFRRLLLPLFQALILTQIHQEKKAKYKFKSTCKIGCLRQSVHVLLFSKTCLYCCNNALSTAATASFQALILTQIHQEK